MAMESITSDIPLGCPVLGVTVKPEGKSVQKEICARGNLSVFFWLNVPKLYHELSCRITGDPDPIDPVSTLFCKPCTAEKEEDRYCEWLRGLDAVGSEYQHQFKGSKKACDSLAMLINGRSGIWSSLWTLRKKKKKKKREKSSVLSCGKALNKAGESNRAVSIRLSAAFQEHGATYEVMLRQRFLKS